MTDDEIERNRQEFLRRLPANYRTDAANRHVQSHLDIKRIIPELFTGEPDVESSMYHSFLSGWDSAMRIRSEELLEEHTTLHGIISDYELEKLKSDLTKTS